jgi:hypothetical protein
MMIRPLFVALTLGASAALATAQQAPAPAAANSPPTRDVVVTGVRLKDTEAALKACIARKCPPKEDIDATMAHAENEFVAGDYQVRGRHCSAASRATAATASNIRSTCRT